MSKKNKAADRLLRRAVSTYVKESKWDTLQGRAYDMSQAESRAAFEEFLVEHVRNVIVTGGVTLVTALGSTTPPFPLSSSSARTTLQPEP